MFLCLKVACIFCITIELCKRFIDAEANFPNVHRHHKKEIVKNIQPNKIDIVITLNSSNPNKECPGECPKITPLDLEALNIPITPACEETTMCQETTACQDTTTESFICSKEGTFPNVNNCNDFYICHKVERDSDLERINLSCPKGMAFDENINKCTKRAAKLCRSQPDTSALEPL